MTMAISTIAKKGNAPLKIVASWMCGGAIPLR
jgi:hypothetical protein